MNKTKGNHLAKKILMFLPVLLLAGFIIYCLGSCGRPGRQTETVEKTSRSYKGHEGDLTDSNNFTEVYPDTIMTRLDDCQTCHRSGGDCGSKHTTKSACDFCHLLQWADTSCAAPPYNFEDTLNAYGHAYNNGGRTKQALEDIEDEDSDGDGYNNGDEIAAFRYPGDTTSNPGKTQCPLIVMDMDEVQSITPTHGHLQLNNTNKQQYDDYAYYQGVKIKDLLAYLQTNKGVDLTSVTGISAIAPDNFLKGFKLSYINNPFAAGILQLGLDTATLGTCGFVNYPIDEYLFGLTTGATLGIHNSQEQWLALGYLRDGQALTSAYYNSEDGKLEGEGPFRIIVPQGTMGGPGLPDWGADYTTSYTTLGCDTVWKYNSGKDHNAGSMVRGVIAIRLDPKPTGCEEFDYTNGGWAYIDTKQLLIWGTGVPAE